MRRRPILASAARAGWLAAAFVLVAAPAALGGSGLFDTPMHVISTPGASCSFVRGGKTLTTIVIDSPSVAVDLGKTGPHDNVAVTCVKDGYLTRSTTLVWTQSEFIADGGLCTTGEEGVYQHCPAMNGIYAQYEPRELSLLLPLNNIGARPWRGTKEKARRRGARPGLSIAEPN